MRYYFYVLDWFGSEHVGSFDMDDEGEESILVAKEIALRKVRVILRNRLGPSYEPQRARQVIIANHEGICDLDG